MEERVKVIYQRAGKFEGQIEVFLKMGRFVARKKAMEFTWNLKYGRSEGSQ
jgi:hypothetical protein